MKLIKTVPENQLPTVNGKLGEWLCSIARICKATLEAIGGTLSNVATTRTNLKLKVEMAANKHKKY